jgi:hypothetical protein
MNATDAGEEPLHTGFEEFDEYLQAKKQQNETLGESAGSAGPSVQQAGPNRDRRSKEQEPDAKGVVGGQHLGSPMSHGLGTMQWLVLRTLEDRGGMTLAALHRRYLKRWPETYSSAKNYSRSVRNGIARALRRLEKLGKVKRGLDGVWLATTASGGGRRDTAYHEAGHAVIGLAVQLPIAYACIEPGNDRRLGHVSIARGPSPVGYVYKRHGKAMRLDTKSKAATHDAFGNPVRKREPAPEECHAQVVMCIAGPMADAKVQGHTDWRSEASGPDKSIARRYNGKLGDAAKSWEQYEEETAALVDKHWAKIEAVAAHLMKVDFVGASEIDSICQRVVRRQHLKNKSKGNA